MSTGKELYIIAGTYGTGVTRSDATLAPELVVPEKDDIPVLDARDADLARLATEEVEVAGGWGASMYQYAYNDPNF